MSWLTDSLPGIATTVAGGILDVIPGTQAIGLPLTAAGLSMFGTEQTNIGNINAASNATDANMQSAQNQMTFQAQMSNTSYQRAVASMTAAGINPMMAINNGGASTPSGASASAVKPEIQNAIGQGVSSAISMAGLDNTVKATDSQISLNKAQGVKAMADANTSGMTAKNLQLRNQALNSELDAIASKAANEKVQADLDRKAAPYDAVMNRLGTYSNSAKSLTNLFNPLAGSLMKNSPPQRRGTTLMDSTTGEVLNEVP